MDFQEMYQPGERIGFSRLSNGEFVTTGIVLDYHEADRDVRRIDHFHFALREPGTGEWLPAQILNYGPPHGCLAPHIQPAMFDEQWSGYYSAEELSERVGAVARMAGQIVRLRQD